MTGFVLRGHIYKYGKYYLENINGNKKKLTINFKYGVKKKKHNNTD